MVRVCRGHVLLPPSDARRECFRCDTFPRQSGSQEIPHRSDIHPLWDSATPAETPYKSKLKGPWWIG